MVLSAVQVANGVLSITLDDNEQNISVYSSETADQIIVEVDQTVVNTASATEVNSIAITANDIPNDIKVSGLALWTVGLTTIDGKGGNDTIEGSMSPDSIIGGDGDDLIFGGGQGDVIVAAAGNDWVFGNSGGDNLDGGAGEDQLFGQNGFDTVTGGTGSDGLNGGDGEDVFDETSEDLIGDAYIVVDDITVDETDRVATFWVGVTDYLNQPVKVDYFTVDGTAIAGEDYEPISQQTLEFSPTERQIPVQVRLLDDDILEGQEFFFLRLVKPIDAKLDREVARADINNVAGDAVLNISNGQYVDDKTSMVPSNKKQTVGAFTIVNLNNSDSDKDKNGEPLRDDKDDDVPGEKDLMKLVITSDLVKSGKVAKSKVFLNVAYGQAKFWKKSSKGSEIANEDGKPYVELTHNPDPTARDTNGRAEVWVETTQVVDEVKAGQVGTIKIESKHRGNTPDHVVATGIWAELVNTRLKEVRAIVKEGKTVTGSVLNFADFEDEPQFKLGDWVLFYKYRDAKGNSAVRNELVERRKVLAVNPTKGTITLGPGPLIRSYTHEDLIHRGLFGGFDFDATKPTRGLSKFEENRVRFGAEHQWPRLANGIAFKFQVNPKGITHQKTAQGNPILIDITRQKSVVGYSISKSGIFDAKLTIEVEEAFPSEDERPNDDAGNKDSDLEPPIGSDLVYSFDAPGIYGNDQNSREAPKPTHYIQGRHHKFFEFVRIDLNGVEFESDYKPDDTGPKNKKGEPLTQKPQGSRASAKEAWSSEVRVGVGRLFDKDDSDTGYDVLRRTEQGNWISMGHKERDDYDKEN